MYCASSFTPNGAGDSFFRFSIAFNAMPFFGPSLAGRSNSRTGTWALIRCAAICAPITPAPSTATLRMFRLLTLCLRERYSKRRCATSVKDVAQCKRGLEQGFVVVHQRLRSGPRSANRRCRFRQQLGEIEPRGGELRFVERIAFGFLVQRNTCHARPEIREHEMPDGAHIRHGSGADFVWILHRLHADFHGQLLHLIADIRERVDELLHLRLHAFFFHEVGYELAELLQLAPMSPRILRPSRSKA